MEVWFIEDRQNLVQIREHPRNGTKTELLVHSPCSFICVQSCTCKLVFLGVAPSKVATYIHLECVCQFTGFTCVGGCRANTGKCGVIDNFHSISQALQDCHKYGGGTNPIVVFLAGAN